MSHPQNWDNGYYDLIPDSNPRIKPYWMHYVGHYSGKADKLYYFNYSERLKNAQESAPTATPTITLIINERAPRVYDYLWA